MNDKPRQQRSVDFAAEPNSRPDRASGDCGTQAQSLKGKIIVHCDTKTLDVGEVYERLGHTQFPATITLSGAQLQAYFGLPDHHDLYLILSDKPYDDRMISPVEPVTLQNGMKFYSCPRGHF